MKKIYGKDNENRLVGFYARCTQSQITQITGSNSLLNVMPYAAIFGIRDLQSNSKSLTEVSANYDQVSMVKSGDNLKIYAELLEYSNGELGFTFTAKTSVESKSITYTTGSIAGSYPIYTIPVLYSIHNLTNESFAPNTKYRIISIANKDFYVAREAESSTHWIIRFGIWDSQFTGNDTYFFVKCDEYYEIDLDSNNGTVSEQALAVANQAKSSATLALDKASAVESSLNSVDINGLISI